MKKKFKDVSAASVVNVSVIGKVSKADTDQPKNWYEFIKGNHA